jgi:hypothetical protein
MSNFIIIAYKPSSSESPYNNVDSSYYTDPEILDNDSVQDIITCDTKEEALDSVVFYRTKFDVFNEGFDLNVIYHGLIIMSDNGSEDIFDIPEIDEIVKYLRVESEKRLEAIETDRLKLKEEASRKILEYEEKTKRENDLASLRKLQAQYGDQA